MSDELTRLQAEAGVIDAEAAPPLPDAPVAGEQPATAAPAVNSVTEASAIITTCVAIATPAWPFLPSIYTAEQISTLAGAWGPVMDHYGITAGDFFSHPVAQAALITLPVAIQTMQAAKAQKAAQAVQQRAEGSAMSHPSAVPAPGQMQGEAV